MILANSFSITSCFLNPCMCFMYGVSERARPICRGVKGFVEQTRVRPVIPYHRKYGRPYHTWLGYPH